MESKPNDEKHERKICPRCGGSFVCKANRIHHCDCMGVLLSDETVEYIRQHYDDCLCVACLQALQQGVGGKARYGQY
jgi:hypothetical protein